MRRNQRIGRWGEEAAAEYLSSRGFVILERNHRTPYGEIDLVTRKDGQTVLVEVKTRTSKSLGPPEISVGARKRAHMIACAEHYAQGNALAHWRIDVIAVEKIAGEIRIRHFENAVG